MKNTGVMCMVFVGDKAIDMGNYYTDKDGKRCLITRKDLAQKYGFLVDCPIYVFKDA